MISLKAIVIALLASPGAAFTARGVSPSSANKLFASVAAENDLTKPAYEVEPIPIRIGHGFDIHRMAPVEEAGQPVVIGGVTITHKDQKVRTFDVFSCENVRCLTLCHSVDRR